MTTVFATHKVLLASGVTVPTEFALAFALSRPFRRIRFPLEVATAALLTKVFPPLKQVKISELIKPPKMLMPNRKPSPPGTPPSTLDRVLTFVENGINNYGVAYLLGARIVGVGSVLTIYYGLRHGVALDPVFDYFNLNKKVGEVLGTWALAVTLNSVLYPGTLLAGGLLLTPLVYRTRLTVARLARGGKGAIAVVRDEVMKR